jgi:hypothetical protein
MRRGSLTCLHTPARFTTAIPIAEEESTFFKVSIKGLFAWLTAAHARSLLSASRDQPAAGQEAAKKAKVRTEEGKLYLFVAIDRTSKFACAELQEKAIGKARQPS